MVDAFHACFDRLDTGFTSKVPLTAMLRSLLRYEKTRCFVHHYRERMRTVQKNRDRKAEADRHAGRFSREHQFESQEESERSVGWHVDSSDQLDEIYFAQPSNLQAPPTMDGLPRTISFVMLLRVLLGRHMSHEQLKIITTVWAQPSNRLSSQQLTELTALYDHHVNTTPSNDGFLTVDDLRTHAIKDYKELLTPDELDLLMADFDTETDGKVTLVEYIRFYRQLWHTIPTSFVSSVIPRS
jgi:hypothetical protein